MTIAATVQVKHIRAALLAASKQDVRYYLNGISVEPDLAGATLISTDGHRIHVVRVTISEGGAASMDYSGAPFIVPRDACEVVCKGGKRMSESWVTISIDGPTMRLRRDDGLSVECSAIDGKFPEWRRIIPTRSDEERGAANFNPQYIMDASKAASELGSRFAYPFIRHNGDGPALVSFEGIDNFAAVIMPVRVSDNYPTEAFNSAPVQQQEAA